MDERLYLIIPLLLGWTLDRLLGDPQQLPHPVVGFGKLIAWGEKKLNQGKFRLQKGAILAFGLILLIFCLCTGIIKGLYFIHPYFAVAFNSAIVFYCLAGKTLVSEVKQVFEATNLSVEEGRQQVARIVGRDTSSLDIQQIHTASLETLSENLSDGVIAPLFWYLLLGAPGMLAYKMVNTLDSMLGYKTERYKSFGCIAAHIDDIANFIPARITAILMIAGEKMSHIKFILKYGKQHASPNSGYPEAALASILDCRFGGPNFYFGEKINKPYIGHTNRALTMTDLKKAIAVNLKTEIMMIMLITLCLIVIYN